MDRSNPQNIKNGESREKIKRKEKKRRAWDLNLSEKKSSEMYLGRLTTANWNEKRKY